MNPIRMAVSFVLAGLVVLVAAAPTAAQDSSQGTARAVARSTTSTPLGDSAVTQAHLDQISRLYQATLGRDPDPSGQQYWAARASVGYPLVAVAQFIMSSDEFADRSSGDPIDDAYRWALGREPDQPGYEYWSQFDPSFAVVAIADSAELVAATGTEDPPSSSRYTPIAVDNREGIPASWVDAGHGVYVPPVLLAIRWCESNHNYHAANPSSSARGAYQFLRSSWRDYGHAARYGVSTADQATPAQQDEAALTTWTEYGTSPWNASRHCWG